MPESLVLTSAEIEFLLRSRAPEMPVRENLRLGLSDKADVSAKAGIASLLARGLCTLKGEDVEPSETILAVIAGLSTARTFTRAAGWVQERLGLTYLFDGPAVKLLLIPAAYGQFTVQPLDSEMSTADQMARFLDSCLAGVGESAVLIQFSTSTEKVSIAVAVDEAGVWYLSDSEDSPDRGLPSTRDAVIARIGELLDSGQAAGVR